MQTSSHLAQSISGGFRYGLLREQVTEKAGRKYRAFRVFVDFTKITHASPPLDLYLLRRLQSDL